MSFINKKDFEDVITTPPILNTNESLSPDAIAGLNTTDPLNSDAAAEQLNENQENVGLTTSSDAIDGDCCQEFWTDCGHILSECWCCCSNDDHFAETACFDGGGGASDVITTPPRLNKSDPDATAGLSTTDPLNPDAAAEESNQKKKNARRNTSFDANDAECCLCCINFWVDCGHFLYEAFCCYADNGCCTNTASVEGSGETSGDLCIGCDGCDSDDGDCVSL